MSNTRAAILLMYFPLHRLNLTTGKHLSTHPEVWNSFLNTTNLFVSVYIISASAQLLLGCLQIDRVILILWGFLQSRCLHRRNRMYTIHSLKLLYEKIVILTPLKNYLKKVRIVVTSKMKTHSHITCSQPFLFIQ